LCVVNNPALRSYAGEAKASVQINQLQNLNDTQPLRGWLLMTLLIFIISGSSPQWQQRNSNDYGATL